MQITFPLKYWKESPLFLICYFFPLLSFCQSSIRWELDSLDKINGSSTSLYGSPKLINTPEGKSIEFDGLDDGILVPINPMKNLTEFTIEVLFKPYSDGNFEQRFLHFQQNEDNRILMELRYVNGFWYLDTFIKSGASSRTLIDANQLHRTDQWYHIALVYKNGSMKHYVNGVEELNGTVTYAPVTTGQTSIGVRQTLVNYFKGVIKTVKISGAALAPTDFISNEALALNQAVNLDNEQKEVNSFLIFPLPAKEKASLRFSSISGELKLDLLNQRGESVCSLDKPFTSNGDNQSEILRGNLPAGLYFVRIQGTHQVTTKPFLFE